MTEYDKTKWCLPGEVLPDVEDMTNLLHGVKFSPSAEVLKQAFHAASGDISIPSHHCDKLIIHAVRKSWSEDSACYYLTGSVGMYLSMMLQAKANSARKHKNYYYFHGPEEVQVTSPVFQARLINLMNSNRGSKGESLYEGPSGGKHTRAVAVIEAEIAEFIEHSLPTVKCFRLNELPGQYLHRMLSQVGSLRTALIQDPGDKTTPMNP